MNPYLIPVIKWVVIPVAQLYITLRFWNWYFFWLLVQNQLAHTLLAACVFLALSFWSSESLLALCFFIWLVLCLDNSAQLTQTLQHRIDTVHEALHSGYVSSFHRYVLAQRQTEENKSQMLISITRLVLVPTRSSR
jgi:hypothetical protein